ncbi:PspC domain-containing protein [Myceligenerans crystallogenes]|uniref:Phage shock protein PspC N-terminal domain-containing protein n=1 Tax=Myceligenerans crystallogenes TaxID=316335 RepID=A0ABN2N4Q8_9MICO
MTTDPTPGESQPPTPRPSAPPDAGPQPPSSRDDATARQAPPEHTQPALPRYTGQNPPDYPPPGEQGPRRPAGSGFFDSIRRTGLYRADKRWVGGVAGGFADRIGWDPLLVRGLLVLSLFIGGIGLVAYAIAWALVPEQSDGRIHLEEAIRGSFDVAVLGAAVVLLIGFAWGGPWQWGFYGDSEWVAAIFWLAVIGGVVWLLVKAATKRPSLEGEPHALPYPPAPGQPPRTPHAAQPYPATTAPAAQPRPTATGAAYHGPHYPVPPPLPLPAAPGLPGVPGGQAPYPGAPHPGPRPPRPPKGGGGGIVLGLILLAGAGLLFHRFVLGGDLWFLPSGDGQIFGTWIGISLAVIGVAIVVAGLRGRSSGGLGALAILGLIVAVPAGLVYASDSYIDETVSIGGDVVDSIGDSLDPRVDGYGPGLPITEGTTSPDTITQAERGYAVQWGDPTIDLTDLELPGGPSPDPVEIPVAVGAGTARIVVPADAAVTVDGTISAGVLQWNVDGEHQSYSGFDGRPFELSSDEADDDDAQLHLVIDVSAGEAIIEEER